MEYSLSNKHKNLLKFIVQLMKNRTYIFDSALDEYIIDFNSTLDAFNATKTASSNVMIMLPLCKTQDYYCSLIEIIYDQFNKSTNDLFREIKRRVDLKFNMTLF